MDEAGGFYSKQNKPVTKRKILCDPTSIRHLEQSHAQRKKVECVCQELQGKKSYYLMGFKLLFNCFARRRLLEMDGGDGVKTT